VLDIAEFECVVARLAQVIIRTNRTTRTLESPSDNRLRAASVALAPDVNEIAHYPPRKGEICSGIGVLAASQPRLFHCIDQTLRTHIGPMRLYPSQAFLTLTFRPNCRPPKWDLAPSWPQRMLILMVDEDQVIDTVVFKGVRHGGVSSNA